MTIDVIMPVYNCERYIAEAIESVLTQSTGHAIEVTVVDDGSTDGTAGVIRRFGDKVRYVAKSHAGISDTRNHGIRITCNAFIAFLDADDLWETDKIELQMAAFREVPGLEAVFGQSVQFLSPELDPRDYGRFRITTQPRDLQLPSTLLIRREAFQRIGEFDTTIVVGVDIDWRIRARELGLRSQCLPRAVHRRRVHHANHSFRQRSESVDYVQVLKRSLDRRRLKDGT